MNLVLNQVSKSYGKQTVLHPVDLELTPGQTYVLIGPSGCGKSTLLRLIVGLIPLSGGSVEFDGQAMNADRILMLRRRIGYVIQDGGLFPHLTAAGNVRLMARYLGWDDARIDKRIGELADLTHFPAAGLDRFPTQLSGGQRQRVSLMRALMLDPDLLLMDEPLGALDPMIRSELQNDLREIFLTLGKTVVLVTHDMGEAAFFGDTILLMNDGRVVQRGTFDQLLRRPSDPFVTQFINAQRSPLSGAEIG